MTVSHADRLARVALAKIAEPGNPRLLDLVTDLGAEVVQARLLDHDELGDRLAEIEAERELEAAARSGLRFVVPGDEEWPPGLDDLRSAEAVQERGGVPIGLWVRGPLRLPRLEGSLAVVGARSATTYGTDLAADLAATVGQSGRAIVSGAAYGIDYAAHRGAIAVDAPTVAVLACGADRVYPQKHQQLIDHLAAEGAVVSETVPGGAPMRVRFLSRNRIIAALSVGTVVVEAALRSGALNTANWATRLNRQLMGVPGPVTSAQSAGVHQVIRTGAATLVTSGEEALELLGAVGRARPRPAPRQGPAARRPEPPAAASARRRPRRPRRDLPLGRPHRRAGRRRGPHDAAGAREERHGRVRRGRLAARRARSRLSGRRRS